MSMQDINFMKQNSSKEIFKVHFSIKHDTNEYILKSTVNNVFSIHILSVFTNTLLHEPFIIKLFGNDIEFDSILINSNGLTNNSIGIEYEKHIHPLSKLNAISYQIVSLENEEINIDINDIMNVTVIIRNYIGKNTFDNNTYMDLNPIYNPHIIPLESESDSDSDSES